MGRIEQKLDDMASDLKDIKSDFKSHLDRCDKRFCKLEKDTGENKTAIAKIIAVAVAISTVFGIILKLVWR